MSWGTAILTRRFGGLRVANLWGIVGYSHSEPGFADVASCQGVS